MSAPKNPKSLLLIAILAFVGAALIAGCGGSGGTVAEGQNPPTNPPSAPVEPKNQEKGEEEATQGEEEGGTEEGEEGTEGGTAGGAEAEGEAGANSKEAGEESAGSEEGGGSEEGEAATAGAEGGSAEGMEIFTSNCGSCHTLAAAGTSGNIGPNLDELMPSESTVETQVINGGGAMPAFGKEGILEEGEVKAVAEYVSSVAGE